MGSSTRIRSVRAFGILAFVLASAAAQGQLVLNQIISPTNLVSGVLLGPGVFGTNVIYNGVPGTFVAPVDTSRSEIGKFFGSNTSLGLGTGIFLCTNSAMVHLPGPNSQLQLSGGGMGSAQGIMTPDLDLCRLTGSLPSLEAGGTNIYNKSILEFDLVTLNDMISFRYVFSSEEYERWACSSYNDVFGMFLSGPGISGPHSNNAMNIAIIPGSMSPVSINTVNSGLLNANNANGSSWIDPFQYCFAADSNWQANAQYYRYNGGLWPFDQPPANAPQLEAPYNTDPYYIQHNGMTVVLTASAAVEIGETYHIKMGVSNVSDSKYPSAVFIEQSSFRSSDRFTLTVDEGPNVDLTGTDPVLHESAEDSVYLRFNRWGGFYRDEYLQLSVEGNAVAGVDYLPVLPDSVHFSQLDSAVVIGLAIPVHSGATRELIINLITSNGDKVMAHHLIIDKELTVGVTDKDATSDRLAAFPNPAESTLQVVLPPEMVGRTELRVLDVAGRVVAQQVLHGASTTIDLADLPNGLYTLKADAQGKVATARINVRH